MAIRPLADGTSGDPMTAICRYILRQLFEATVFITIVLACTIWLTQSLRFVELIINRGLSLGAFLYLTSLLLPSFLVIILPVALACVLALTSCPTVPPLPRRRSCERG